MRLRPTPAPDSIRAPHLAGALFLLLGGLFLASCEEPSANTPDWSDSKQSPPSAEAQPSSDQPPPVEPAPLEPTLPSPQTATPEDGADPEVGSNTPPASDSPTSPGQVRFVSYNLKNFLTMSRYVDGERQDRPKPEKEVSTLVRIIAAARPDVLGICEIGTRDDLTRLQSLLAEAGLDLPHVEYAGGADETRHLAFLSRFPIVATDSQGAGGTLTYESVDLDNNPRMFAMQRGILDATVAVGEHRLRFLGVHLKSKREIPEGHQDLMRRNEAYLLRKHADRILEENPEALLCVYGDFNESRRESPVRSISGDYKSPTYLEPLSHKDSRGEVWTHFWEYQHIYSRFDYVLASRALRPRFEESESGILDDPAWFQASDHRPLLSVFRLAP